MHHASLFVISFVCQRHIKTDTTSGGLDALFSSEVNEGVISIQQFLGQYKYRNEL